MDEVTEKLSRAVEDELSMLNSTVEMAKRSEHIEHVKVLCGLLLEREKEQNLKLEKEYQRGLESEKAEIEAQVRLKELRADNIHRCAEAVGGATKVLATGAFLSQIMIFEETGTLGSKAFQILAKMIRF